MELSLLGPVEVTIDGAPVPVPGAGERALLALLGLDAKRVVSSERLVEALWGEELPVNPANALQLRVSKLRKAVGAAVVTRPAGYMLDVAPEAVDVHRFRNLAAEGRFHDALALWRGAPLAEFAGRFWADTVVVGLEEERLRALEGRVEADLSDGRHVELIPQLELLVAEHPTRERFRGLLMLALYRAGRQADALEVFQQARDFLAETLGLDPSPQLQGLEAAILRQDARLEAPTEKSRRGHALPAPLAGMVGRAAEGDRCVALLGEHRLVTLTGPGGAGKTTLATEVAWRTKEDYPDGAWFVRLAEVSEPGRLAQAVVDAVGIVAPDASSPRELLGNFFAHRRALLVLDNCEHLADAVAALADSLLRACADLRMLTTSRGALGVVGEVQLPVAPLPTADAVELFVERATAVAPRFARGTETENTIAAICEALDGMPLAIELAAARTRSLSVEAIAARLDDRFTLLASGPRTAEARHRTLEATVAWSHDLLEADEQRLFRRLAVFAGTWALEDAEAVCAGDGLPRREVLDVLDRLVDRSLVVAEGGRFRLLETIRVYAGDRLAAAGERDVISAAHVRHFGRLARDAEQGLRGPDQARWLALLRANEANLHAVLAWARAHAADDPDGLLRLTAGLAWFWFVARHGDGRRALTAALGATGDDASPSSRALALQAQSIVERPGGCVVHPSPRAADPARESHTLFLAQGDEHRARLSEVLCAVEAVGGVDVEPTLDRLDLLAGALGADGDVWGAAMADFVTMEIHIHQGAIDQALTVGRRARERFATLGDRWGTSAVDAHLGQGLRLAGRTSESVEVLERGLRDAVDAGLRNTIAGISLDLAATAIDAGDHERARVAVQRASTMADELGNALFRGMAEVLAATSAALRDELESALELAARGLQRLRPEGATAHACIALALVASCNERVGELDEADARAQEALALATQIANRGLRARAWEVLAVIAASRGDGDRAAALLGRAAATRAASERPADALSAVDAARAEQHARALLGDAGYEASFSDRSAEATYAAS